MHNDCRKEFPSEAFYGLPANVEFCQRCVVSNQRPSSIKEQAHQRDGVKEVIAFKEGLCDACSVAQLKVDIDWERRSAQLNELLGKYRSRNGSYDCIVPGSGGKDSMMQAWLLKYKYGMNPLTVTWAPHIYTDWGRENFYRWIGAGFDNELVTPNSLLHRLLTRLAFDNLYYPFQPFVIGQRHVASKVALLRNIPLIFYGESGAEYGNSSEKYEESTRSFEQYEFLDDSSPDNIYLGGVSVSELMERYQLSFGNFHHYLPLSRKQVKDCDLQTHYLGYFEKWSPQHAFYFAVDKFQFEPAPERTQGTYSKYNSIDDKMDDLHYYSTYIKFGIGRATYDACPEIRNGDLDREEGVDLVRKYDGEYPTRFETEIFEYLSVDESVTRDWAKTFKQPRMTKELFEKTTDQFRSPHLWFYDDHEGWLLRHKVS